MKTTSIIALASAPLASAWNYADAGQTWSDEFAACGEAGQSPINLPVDGKGDNWSSSVEAPNMAFTITLSKINDNKFAAVGSPANYYSIPGDGGSLSLTKWDGSEVTGTFSSMEIHGSSDHRFDGDQRELELQFFFTENLALSVTYTGMDSYTDDAGQEVTVENDSLLSQLFNTDYTAFATNTKKDITWPTLTSWTEGNFYVYEGTLTRPECTAGLTWIVLQEAVKVPTAQLAGVSGIYSDDSGSYLDGNARAVQEIGDRNIYMKERPAKDSASQLVLAVSSLVAVAATFF